MPVEREVDRVNRLIGVFPILSSFLYSLFLLLFIYIFTHIQINKEI